MQLAHLKKLIFLLLAGCTAQNPWSYDSIDAGDPLFNSKRLTYTAPNGYPPWKIECLEMGANKSVSISLMQHRFHSEEPTKIKVSLSIEGDLFEEWTPIFEGLMKVVLSDSMGNLLIQSLQEGKKVGILIGGFEETLEPDLFKKGFVKLGKNSLNWLNIRNPLQ